MDTLEFLVFLFLLSLAADLIVLSLLVGSLFGSAKRNWRKALVTPVLTWLGSFSLAYAVGTIAQRL